MKTTHSPLRLTVHPGNQVDRALRNAIIDLCTRAYAEDFTELMAAPTDCVHVLGWVDDQVVSHALWVTRWLQVGEGPLLRTAYVEAVATDPAQQNHGFATLVMRRVAAEIQDFELGALSPFSVEWYARLGWEQWHGPLFIRTAEGLLRTAAEDGHVMILRLPQTPTLDLTAPLSAGWRVGELW
jgi:aminoglycoside 2'-N-acetyltransferase I